MRKRDKADIILGKKRGLSLVGPAGLENGHIRACCINMYGIIHQNEKG